MKLRPLALLALAVGLCLPEPAAAQLARPAHGRAQKKLTITRDEATGKVTITYPGNGMLCKTAGIDRRTKPVRRGIRGGIRFSEAPTGDVALFHVDGAFAPLISVNVVGYVNLMLPPGLSLIANPLAYADNSIATWLPTVPSGSQVYKYTPGGGYEVSTFDSDLGGWSSPGLTVPIGTGFYFFNPSTETLRLTFVGEVLQGTLSNPLPAGISTKGSLVPIAGSINSVHHIPGEDGDELRVYVNSPQGAGYVVSTFLAVENAWVPDLDLSVGQGFWIQKTNPQDWVRNFLVNP